MKTMWLIKRDTGYTLREYDGSYCRFFQMACDCKAFCMSLNIKPIIIDKKTSEETLKLYTEMTGLKYV